MNLWLRWGLVSLGLLGSRISLPAQERLAQTPTNIWNVSLGPHNAASPALDYNGNLYVTTATGKLFALNPDGSQRWVFSLNYEIASTPAIGADGTIFFGCRDRRFYAVGADGQPRWSFKTGGWVDASPALGADGTVYVGSFDRKFYALTPEGKVKWAFATGGPITSSAAIDANGGIYFGSHDRKFYALQPDGTKRWEFATDGAILSSPAIGPDGALYFTSADGYLLVVNADGSLRWKSHTSGINTASPVLGVEGTIFLGVNTNHCEFSAEGKLLWRRSLSEHGYPPMAWIVATPVALEDNLVFTAGTDLYVCIFARGGPGLWHQSLKSGIYASPVVTADGTAYVAAVGTGVFAYKDMPRPAHSSWPMFRANLQRTGRVATDF